MIYNKQLLPRLSTLLLLTVTAVGCAQQEVGEHPTPMNPATRKVSLKNTIEIGTAIESATTDMSENGFEETMLAMVAGDSNLSLKMWTVGDGVLSVLYDESDSKLRSLEY